MEKELACCNQVATFPTRKDILNIFKLKTSQFPNELLDIIISYADSRRAAIGSVVITVLSDPHIVFGEKYKHYSDPQGHYHCLVCMNIILGSLYGYDNYDGRWALTTTDNQIALVCAQCETKIPLFSYSFVNSQWAINNPPKLVFQQTGDEYIIEEMHT